MKSAENFYNMRARWLLLMALFIAGINGCTKDSTISLTSEYQAVFLDNGQAFFGKLSNADTAYPLLQDVFYIQQQVNKDTNEVKSILIKRGNEWHGPDHMRINTTHIVLIEPVSSDSQVYKLIIEAKRKNGEDEKEK